MIYLLCIMLGGFIGMSLMCFLFMAKAPPEPDRAFIRRDRLPYGITLLEVESVTR